ncbi:hypothetical protein, partial [Mesorhizobium sp.]
GVTKDGTATMPTTNAVAPAKNLRRAARNRVSDIIVASRRFEKERRFRKGARQFMLARNKARLRL